MISRSDGPLTYLSLGQRKASVERIVSANQMVRLQRECLELGSSEVKLNFDRDERYRVTVEGSVQVVLSLPCNMCQEPVSVDLRTEFRAIIATSEEQADHWSAGEIGCGVNIVVIEAPRLDIVELIEDELLLDLPSPLCNDTECADRPAMVYEGALIPDEELADRNVDTQTRTSSMNKRALNVDATKLESEDRQFPFSGLKAAISQLDGLNKQDEDNDHK